MFIVPLVGWLVTKGLPSWLAELIIWLVIALIVVILAGYLWESKIHHPYVKEGMEKQQKIDEPKIKAQTERADLAESRLNTALTANKTLADSIDGPGGLRAQVKESKDSIDLLTQIANQARTNARALLAKLNAQTQHDMQEIARLRAAANGPPIVEKVCETTNAILSDLAIWRLAQ